FLVEKFPEDARLIRLARNVNDRMPVTVTEKIARLMEGKKSGKITILGLAYKGNVDDDRESPAVAIVRHLQKQYPQWELGIYEPHVRSREFKTVGVEDAFRGSDLAVVLTAHDEYKFLDPAAVGGLMSRRVVLDTHNLLKSERWVPAGFVLHVLGAGVGEAAAVR
ncbi:MAG: hypothetical protein JO102_01760, partial [Elusimicrobia bacterium]|nr:hypothetical protein [Elusimicrobiota bacterium]